MSLFRPASIRTRVKICGLTRPEDARTAAELGADAIGLNFYPPSPRVVKLTEARAIVAALPPFVKVVGLFVDAEPNLVRRMRDSVPLDLLQFHGEENSSECERYAHPYIKAIRVRAGLDLERVLGGFESASGLLLDSWHPEVPGGSGQSFDWALIPRETAKPIILAGGLTPANVAEAIRRVRPFAVDVCGGVESAKGIKDAAKMAAFMEGVDSARATEPTA